tara:strand:+ start:100 stop:396 length:297 start_codon:yes stop_codon:yes gene_type:complete
MAYNIMKTMYDDKGRKKHILLNNGLSEILTYEDVNEAMTMVTILNDNADSRTEYEIRPTHSIAKRTPRPKWPHKISSDDPNTQRMIDLMTGTDEDPPD